MVICKREKLLGHKDIKMTQRYSHHWRDGVAVLDKATTGYNSPMKKGLRLSP